MDSFTLLALSFAFSALACTLAVWQGLYLLQQRERARVTVPCYRAVHHVPDRLRDRLRATVEARGYRTVQTGGSSFAMVWGGLSRWSR